MVYRRKYLRRTKRLAHPDGGFDPFNAPDADSVWWGFIEDAEDIDYATAPPTSAARKRTP
jgi:hypothetical protein